MRAATACKPQSSKLPRPAEGSALATINSGPAIGQRHSAKRRSVTPPAFDLRQTAIARATHACRFCDDCVVVRTGARATVLAGLLKQGGCTADAHVRPAPRIADFESAIADDLVTLYRDLGGIHDPPDLRPGPWDLSFDGILIELDEELHFNRYRGSTLGYAWASRTPWASRYRDMCTEREGRCLRAGKWGQRWTSKSSARMFGAGAPPGRLDDIGGAPRWKQRAMYDAMKDAVAANAADIRVARLSVWDEVSGELLGNVLEGRGSLHFDDLLGLLSTRTS